VPNCYHHHDAAFRFGEAHSRAATLNNTNWTEWQTSSWLFRERSADQVRAEIVQQNRQAGFQARGLRPQPKKSKTGFVPPRSAQPAHFHGFCLVQCVTLHVNSQTLSKEQQHFRVVAVSVKTAHPTCFSPRVQKGPAWKNQYRNGNHSFRAGWLQDRKTKPACESLRKVRVVCPALQWAFFTNMTEHKGAPI
jgi:hypothetical protein